VASAVPCWRSLSHNWALALPAKDLLPYIIAQVLGAIAATFTLYIIASGKASLS
jgi:glycerol uptake facilitator-like aquaporin